MLDSTPCDSSHWAQLLITPLPFPLNSYVHSYIGLINGDSCHRIEVEGPLSFMNRIFEREVISPDEILKGLEVNPFMPFYRPSSEAIGEPIHDRTLVESILQYSRETLPSDVPQDARYCPNCTTNSCNSNSVVSIVCSKFPQLGELPKEAVGRRLTLEDIV